LEEFKKKVTKDVLKQANMTEEDYQRFLKAYEEMLKKQAPPAEDKETLAGPQRGGGSLRNQGVRQVQPGGPTKTGNLERGGAAEPPPEFRESYKVFSKQLSELEKTREKRP
jgi:hypothetical protein